MQIRINKGGRYWQEFDYAKIEEIKKAKWVADLCVKDRHGNWSEIPVAVFWQPEPPEGMNPYFGVFLQRGSMLICSAMSAVEGLIEGVISEDGEVLFSRFRHDYRTSEDGTAMVDGGRDYTRSQGKRVLLFVEGPDIKLMDEVLRPEDEKALAE